MRLRLVFILGLVLALSGPFCAYSAPPLPISTEKPEPEKLMKPKSLERILEEQDPVMNSEWTNDDDFKFVTGVYIRVPFEFARPVILNFSQYQDISSTIKKVEYNAAKKELEVMGEAGGLKMHSWMQVDDTRWDEIRYKIVRGNMTGFDIRTYFWNKKGRTLAIAQGVYPKGRKILPAFVATVFKPLSEVVIGVATKNFRSYIEKEHSKKKNSQ